MRWGNGLSLDEVADSYKKLIQKTPAFEGFCFVARRRIELLLPG